MGVFVFNLISVVSGGLRLVRGRPGGSHGGGAGRTNQVRADQVDEHQ